MARLEYIFQIEKLPIDAILNETENTIKEFLDLPLLYGSKLALL